MNSTWSRWSGTGVEGTRGKACEEGSEGITSLIILLGLRAIGSRLGVLYLGRELHGQSL